MQRRPGPRAWRAVRLSKPACGVPQRAEHQPWQADMTSITWPPGHDELRFLLREHSLAVAPGEVLVVMVPTDWPPPRAGPA